MKSPPEGVITVSKALCWMQLGFGVCKAFTAEIAWCRNRPAKVWRETQEGHRRGWQNEGQILTSGHGQNLFEPERFAYGRHMAHPSHESSHESWLTLPDWRLLGAIKEEPLGGQSLCFRLLLQLIHDFVIWSHLQSPFCMPHNALLVRRIVWF